MIRDRNIEYARQRLYIPVGHMSLTGGGVSMHDTVPALVELGTDKTIAGMAMTANDTVAHGFEFPSFWDITKEIGCRVIWTAKDAAIATDAAEWIVLYDQVDVDEAIIAPATVLDTIINSAVLNQLQLYGTTTDQVIKRTDRGIINANTFNIDALDGFFSFSIELQAVTTFGADEVELIGISFDYYPMLTVGGMNAAEGSRQ